MCLEGWTAEGCVEGKNVGEAVRQAEKRNDRNLMEGSFVRMKRRAEGRKEWKEWMPGTCLRAEHL